MSTNLILLKYAISKKYPYTSIDNEHFYYATLKQY